MTAFPLAAPTAPAARFPDDGRIERSLALGRRLLAAVARHAEMLGVPGFDVDLPPVVGSDVDQSHLRTVPPLYLASELEQAGLIPAVELLTGLFSGGGLAADLGPATPLLIQFWRNRNQRFTASERQAFFARLFGTAGPTLAIPSGENADFEDLMISLTEALYKLSPEPALANLGLGGVGSAAAVTLQTAAAELAANLVPRSGGMASYAAGDVLTTVEQALAILKTPAVQAAFGTSSVWAAIDAINRRYQRGAFDIDSHVTRGKSGMLVLAWLAEIAPQTDNPRSFQLSPTDPVIAAATAWLQSSLTIQEHLAAQPGRAS